jgi:VanZ family protein
MLTRVLLWVPAFVQMAFIFAASSVPANQLPGHIWDKLAHLIVYALLGIFFLIPLARGRLSGVTFGAATLAIALSFVYGLSDELHQSFVPNRTPDVLDVLADTLGATVGVVLMMLVRAVVERVRPSAR